MNNNTAKGFAPVVIVVAVVLILGIGLFVSKDYIMDMFKKNNMMKEEMNDEVVKDDLSVEEIDTGEFETLEEDNSTPEEFDNVVLDELDSLMNNIENNNLDNELTGL